MVCTVKEVNGHRGFQVVFQKGSPRLRRWTPTTGHVFPDAGLADVNAESEKFAVDTRRAPSRVLAAHRADQFPNLLRNRRSAGPTVANLPSPKQSKSSAVPRYDGVGFDEAQCGPPAVPDSTKPGPQEPVEPIELRSLHRALQHAKLVAEGDDFKLQCRPRSKNRQHRREQCR